MLSAVAGQNELYTLLWQVASYSHLMGEEAFAGTPLTVSSGSMLIAVLEEPGLTVADFSRRIPKTQQTLAQVVARLEKLGLIERRLRPGRGVGLYLTEAGQQMAEDAVAREQEVNARLHALLGADRAATLTGLLQESRAILRETR